MTQVTGAIPFNKLSPAGMLGVEEEEEEENEEEKEEEEKDEAR